MKYKVDIVPQLDITGNFKKLKDVGEFFNERTIYNQLITILTMRRGFHPMYPYMGVADLIASIPFNNTIDVGPILDELEAEVKQQMGSDCTVSPSFKTDQDGNKYVLLFFRVSLLSFDVAVKYNQNDPNIRVVNPEMITDLHGGGI